MYKNKLLVKFARERNIKKSTIKGYVSALTDYTSFHKLSIDELIKEARTDEEKQILLKNRQIKKRLMDYREFLVNKKASPNTIKTYLSKIKTFYTHFEIELPQLPEIKYGRQYQTSYLDLPTHEDIRKVLDSVPIDFKALILFMSSSGTAKAETLSLTVRDFIKATKGYYKSTDLEDILAELSLQNDIVPTLYLKRIKTDKYYYTFCSPEATLHIIKYLKTRDNLKLSDKLFLFTDSLLITRFQKINDEMNWGFKGKYRYFRSHTLRKFHASNIGLHSEYIDALQGRSKNIIHETYIKTNPDKLKEIYIGAMDNVRIYSKNKEEQVVHEDIYITINVFLSDTQYNIY